MKIQYPSSTDPYRAALAHHQKKEYAEAAYKQASDLAAFTLLDDATNQEHVSQSHLLDIPAKPLMKKCGIFISKDWPRRRFL